MGNKADRADILCYLAHFDHGPDGVTEVGAISAEAAAEIHCKRMSQCSQWPHEVVRRRLVPVDVVTVLVRDPYKNEERKIRVRRIMEPRFEVVT